MTTKRSDIVFTLVAGCLDLAMIFSAFAAAYWLRSQTELIQTVALWPWRDYLSLIGLMLPCWIVIFILAGLYRHTNGRAQWGQFTKIFMAVSASIMLFVVWVFLSRTLFFSRLIVIYAWVLAIIFVLIGRILLSALQRFLYRYRIGVRSVVIVGKTETAEQLKNELQTHPELGYRVINGLVSPTITALRQWLAGHLMIDEIIVADSELPSSQILELIAISEELGIDFRLVPNLFEVKSTNVEVETLAAIPIIAYRQTPLGGWASLLKRIFDFSLASLGLIILSPLYLLIGVLIKLDSAGPVLYRHRRLGYDRKPFYLYKFRSMKLDYCVGDEYQRNSDHEVFTKVLNSPELDRAFQKDFKLKVNEDPRVTRLGRFLRQTSLDELPQLLNVWLGQLSLVGPRPIVEDELKRYGQYRHRLFIVKPGVTGLWQVSGRSDMPYRDRVKLDMFYIENWSLWTDLVILIKTFFVVLLRKNAY